MSEGSSERSCEPRKGETNQFSKRKASKSGNRDTMGTTDPRTGFPNADIPDCAVCLQSCIHPVELPCSHVFCFLCMKGASTHYRRCALCRQEIPVDFFSSPKLLQAQEEEEEESAESEECYAWFYEGRNGWWQYEERTNAELEESYRASKRTFDLLIAGYVYVIDLDSMLQYRRTDPSRRRRIKRDLVTAPKKGIAGLKIKVKCEEESGDRQVDGAEEEKENAGAVGGATTTPVDDDKVKSKNGTAHDEDVVAEDVAKSDIGVTNSTSPNANHSNSTSNERVYEVVRNSPSPHRTTEGTGVTYRYTTPSPSSEQAPAYAMPSRQRQRPANQSTTDAADSQTSRDGSSPSPTRSPSVSPSLQASIHHQRTHSAPETRHSGRPRYPAPPAPPRTQAPPRSNQPPSIDNEDADSDVQNLADTMRSELVVSVDSTSHARRRQVHRHVHEV